MFCILYCGFFLFLNILEPTLKVQSCLGYIGFMVAGRISSVKTMQWLLKLLVECDMMSLLSAYHWPETILWSLGPDANARGGCSHPTGRSTEEISYRWGQWIFGKNSTIYCRVLYGQEPCLTHGHISRTTIMHRSSYLFIDWKDWQIAEWTNDNFVILNTDVIEYQAKAFNILIVKRIRPH